MSRSGYSDYDGDGDQWASIRWAGAVKAAIRGKRGQAFLIEMRDALDAMPAKRLCADSLREPTGEVCAMGAVAAHRGLDVANIDPEDREEVAAAFGISPALAAEIAYMNDDECGWRPVASVITSDEARWQNMRKWVERQITKVKP